MVKINNIVNFPGSMDIMLWMNNDLRSDGAFWACTEHSGTAKAMLTDVEQNIGRNTINIPRDGHGSRLSTGVLLHAVIKASKGE